MYLGNLNALRDWGHARDYVEAMWLILQQDAPDDFVIATGHQISVRDFVERCAQRLGWGGISWSGSGVNEIGVRNDTGEVVIRIDPHIIDLPKSVAYLVMLVRHSSCLIGSQNFYRSACR